MTETVSRPVDDEGPLLAGGTQILNPQAILEQALPALTGHLERVAWWPPADGGTGWQIGDFSFCVLEFRVAAAALLYAQVWSEPGEAVLVEVSSGAWSPPAGDHIPDAARQALLNRGFETGGRAGNYRKLIQLATKADCRKLARELLAVLTECLGYDGRAPLHYKLHLGQRTRPARVFESLTFDDFGRLLRACGFTVEPAAEGNREAYRTTGQPLFVAGLQCESDEHAGHFSGFTLSLFARLAPAVSTAVEQELQGNLPFAQVFIDGDGDLCVRQHVFAGGGVTESHLRAMLEFWRVAMRSTGEAIEKHADVADERVLN
ncbi:MAG: hypothetical protein FJ191_02950 [Gammaproteobacteria bacterium]|nr:hypothetical protein [Gammaproteobacteria bacterium]